MMSTAKPCKSPLRSLGMPLYLVKHNLTNHTQAFRSLESDPPDALVVSNWTSNWVRRQAIFDFAAQRRLPVTYPAERICGRRRFDVIWGEPPRSIQTHGGLRRQDHQGCQPSRTAHPAPNQIRARHQPCIRGTFTSEP